MNIDQLFQSTAAPIGLALGVGMFLGWMIGFIRGHKAGLRERAARFRR